MGCSTVLQVKTHLEGHKSPSAVCFEMSLFLVLKGDWGMYFHKMGRYGRTYWQPFEGMYHECQFLMSIMALQLMLPDGQGINKRQDQTSNSTMLYFDILCAWLSSLHVFSTNNTYIYTQVYTTKFTLVEKYMQCNELLLIILTDHSQVKKLSFVFYLSCFHQNVLKYLLFLFYAINNLYHCTKNSKFVFFY